MTYHQILEWLTQFNLYAWLIAACLTYWMLYYTNQRGWIVVMIGSVAVTLRQAWMFMPGYKTEKALDVAFNAYMMKFIMGSLGAIILGIGFFMLISNYVVLKTKMEDF